MKGRVAPFMFVGLLMVLPLYAAGHLRPIDDVLSSFFDSVLSPLSPPAGSLVGPMPRETSLRRVVDKTENLLKSEGRNVDHDELVQIARVVERASLAYRLPPSLIFSVIHSESHFQHNAVSPDGAMGLMQIQAETARHFAAIAGLPVPTSLGLFDRETNILLGTGYLRLLIDRFGNLRTALAAYHLGPGEINRRLAVGQPFSDEYGWEIRAREVFFTTSLPPRAAAGQSSTTG